MIPEEHIDSPLHITPKPDRTSSNLRGCYFTPLFRAWCRLVASALRQCTLDLQNETSLTDEHHEISSYAQDCKHITPNPLAHDEAVDCTPTQRSSACQGPRRLHAATATITVAATPVPGEQNTTSRRDMHLVRQNLKADLPTATRRSN